MGTLTWYFRNLKRVEQVEGGKETTSKDLKCYESQKKRTLFWWKFGVMHAKMVTESGKT